MKILAYHSISDRTAEAGSGLYCVPEAVFRQQLEYLVGSRELGVGSVELTFDDGDITNYTKALPILKKFGMKAYFFIIVGWIGAAGYMNWQQIKELKDNGMTIGSHGMTHRVLTTLKDNELEYEFKTSRKILEDNLGVSIDAISLPRGLYNNRVVDKVKSSGYKKVFTSAVTDSGGFLFGRIPVRSGWDIRRFISAIDSGPSFIDKTKGFIKNSARKTLGDKNYDRIRSGLLK